MMKITIPRKFALVLVALFVCLGTYAQTLNVSGVVLDATNQPVVGAFILVKGTTNGTQANLDGTYTIKAKANDILVAQSIGYKDQEIKVDGRTKIDFLLEEDSQLLDQAVVVGYGTLKKTQLVGSVENLSGDVIQDRPNANVTRSLQGQVAGLNIIQTDGKSNHSGKIYVRGNATSYNSRSSMGSASGASHSIGNGGSALVLIDGVEGDLATVNPADIATVAVLKDASSAAIYGAKGCYGVILVTTKDAEGEKVTVSYNGTVSLNTRAIKWEDHIVSDGLVWLENFYNFFSGDTRVPGSTGNTPSKVNTFTIYSDYLTDFRAKRQIGDTNPYYYSQKTGYQYFASTNWIEEFYKKNNMSTTHDISIKGSSKKLSFAITGRYFTQDGIYKVGEEDIATYNIRAKGKLKVNDWLSFDENMSLYRSKYVQPMFTTSSVLGKQLEQHGQPIFTPYNEDGTWTLAAGKTGYEAFAEGNTGQSDDKMTFVTSTGMEIVPFKDVFKIRGDFSYKAIRNVRERYRAPLSYYTAPSATPIEYVAQESSYKSHWDYNYDVITANVVGTFTPKLGENHDLNIVAGWNVEDYRYHRFYLQRKGMLYPSKNSMELFDGEMTTEQNGSEYAMVGFFGRINYTLLRRYIFEFSCREDGSSKFPSNSQWGFFPSASIGWRVSEEPWMKWSKTWMDNFKLRANYGSLGNGTVSPYTFLETMGIDKSSIIFDGGFVNYTKTPATIPSTLTWETVTTYDLGFDADFLKSRLSFSGDIYVRNTDDLITTGPTIPALYGTSAPKGNYASLQTKGWEFTVSWRDAFKLAGKDFTYSVKGSVWDTRTWVTDYYNTSGNILNYYKDKELGEIWGFRTDGFFKSNDEANDWATDTFHKNGSNFREYAGDLKFIDVDGDGDINYGKGTLDDHGDLERIGNTTPRYQFGINLDFKWNNIGLSLFFQGVGKRDWYPAVESGYFWGMYNRPYGFLMKDQIGDNVVNVDYSTDNWVVTNADKNPYWTRQVGYSANRNVGPLTFENDHYLQNAAYIRLKNLTIDYTLPKKLVEKASLSNVKVYFTAENLWTYSPIYKHTKMFDPEVIATGDSDFDSTSEYGLSGVGDGYSYPMLKTFTFGVNFTF